MKIARYFVSGRNYMKGIRFHLKEFSEICRSQEKMFVFSLNIFPFSFFFSFFSVLHFAISFYILFLIWFFFLAKNAFLLTFYVLSLKKYESCLVLHLEKNVRKFPN